MQTALAREPRLEVLREVASGPSATVFAAELADPSGADRRLVALKVARVGSPRDGESRHEHLHRIANDLQRALGVQRRLGALQQRHMVCAHALAVVGGRPALVRDWVEGIDLLDWVEVLRETGIELPARVVCEVMRSVAVALDAALHRTPWGDVEAASVVHGDVKPTNILVGRDGDVRVLDFGSGYSSIGDEDTRSGALRAGLLKYLAPERREGLAPRPASDVYSLGILAIELFRGRWLRRLRGANPAHDRHLAEVVAAMPDPDLRSQADDRALRNLLLRMVAFDALDRPSAVEVAQTLRSLGDRAPGASLETFAHDHALPYLEHPSPLLDHAPPAAWGLVALDRPPAPASAGASARDESKADRAQPGEPGHQLPVTTPHSDGATVSGQLGPSLPPERSMEPELDTEPPGAFSGQQDRTEDLPQLPPTPEPAGPVTQVQGQPPEWRTALGEPGTQAALWLILAGLLMLSAGALLGGGATAFMVLVYRVG